MILTADAKLIRAPITSTMNLGAHTVKGCRGECIVIMFIEYCCVARCFLFSVYFGVVRDGRYTRCVWAGGTYMSFPDFCDNRQFYVIYCVYSC